MTPPIRNLMLAAAAAAALAACSPAPTTATKAPAATTPAPKAAVSDAPAGTYFLDPSHASVNFRVSHMGFSNYTARFTGLEAVLKFDPANPQAATVVAHIDPRTIQTNYPDKKTLDFDAELHGPEWLDSGKFPQITFVSTKVEQTGPATAKITGNLSLHGVTKPLTLDATFNGGYAGNSMDPGGARIGFSAHGTLNRGDFGVAYGIPAPGTTMGVSDAVEIIIEAEFTSKPTAPKD